MKPIASLPAFTLALTTLVFVACNENIGVPDGYCENECTDSWTPNCERDCGISDPNRAGSSGNGGNSGTSGGRSGAGNDGGASGNDSGTGGSSGTGADGGNGGTSDGGSGGDGGIAGGAGDAGTGGDGMTPACTEDADCDDLSLPECSDDGVCVECSSSAACNDRGARDMCDEGPSSATFGECVECTVDAECPSDQPACVDGLCSACENDDPCTGRGVKAHCDDDSSSLYTGQCVECTDHDHCENPTPECGAIRECQACSTGDACSFRSATPDCNTVDNATQGQCVACIASTEVTRCGPKACILSSGTCSANNRLSRTACQLCATDAECVTGAKCVEQPYGSDTFGPFCFFVDDSTQNCADMSASVRPYSDSTALESVDGFGADYCLPVTTCKAIEDATAMGASGGKVCASNADCGEAGVDDGYCPTSGAASDKCSYTCDNDYDCPDTGFTACGGVSPAFCQP